MSLVAHDVRKLPSIPSPLSTRKGFLASFGKSGQSVTRLHGTREPAHSDTGLETKPLSSGILHSGQTPQPVPYSRLHSPSRAQLAARLRLHPASRRDGFSSGCQRLRIHPTRGTRFQAVQPGTPASLRSVSQDESPPAPHHRPATYFPYYQGYVSVIRQCAPYQKVNAFSKGSAAAPAQATDRHINLHPCTHSHGCAAN